MEEGSGPNGNVMAPVGPYPYACALILAGRKNPWLTKSAGQHGESERLAPGGHQGANFARSAARATRLHESHPLNIGHFCRDVATGCQPEVRMNSKWEEFGSPNRFRTKDLLVNRDRKSTRLNSSHLGISY